MRCKCGCKRDTDSRRWATPACFLKDDLGRVHSYQKNIPLALRALLIDERNGSFA